MEHGKLLVCAFSPQHSYRRIAGLFWLMAAVVTAVASPALFAAEYDVSQSITPATYAVSVDTLMFTSDGTVGSGWYGTTMSVENNASLTIGKHPTLSFSPLTITLDGLITEDSGTIQIERGLTGVTNVTVATLNMFDGGDLYIRNGRSASEHNVLHFTDLTTGNAAATVTVESDSLFEHTGYDTLYVGGTNGAFTLNLGTSNGNRTGDASFANGLVVENGTIEAKKSGGRLAVGDTGLTVMQGGISATGGGTLNILTDLDGRQLADVTLDGSGSKIITVTGGSTINLNKLTVDGDASVTGNGSGNGNKLNMAELEVKAEFTDHANVATTVSGETVIDGSGRYITAGTNNVYSGGILVSNGGELTSVSAATKITVGRSGNGTVELDGGTLASGSNASDGFTVAAKLIDITGSGSELDASAGNLNLSSALVRVNPGTGTVNIIADKGIIAREYLQTSGTVNAETSGTGMFAVTGAARIGGGSDTADYIVIGESTHFQSGVTVANNGSITAGSSGAAVNIGNAGKIGTIALTGGGTLNGGVNTLELIDKSTAKNSSIIASGFDNRIIGDVESDMNMVVSSNDVLKPAVTIYGGSNGLKVKNFTVQAGEAVLGSGMDGGMLSTTGGVSIRSGGVLAAVDSDAFITYTGATSPTGTVSVQRGGTLSTRTADITITGYNSVTIAGHFLAGLNANTGTAAVMESDSNVTITSTGSVGLTKELALAAVGDEILIHTTNGIITSRASLIDHSMFGLYGFKITNSNTELVIDSVKNKITGDYSDEDLARALDNLRKLWGKDQIGKDLGEIIYNASVEDPNTGEYGIIADPEDSIPGNKNIDIFQALASPRGKSVSRNTLEMVNGAHNFGVAEVAIATTQSMLQNINQRTRAVGAQLMAAAESADSIGSSDALATQVLNQLYSKRFWIGGFHTWDDTEGHDDFSGHEYDANGFIMGYDQVVNCYTVVGGSFAHAKGDYKDKGAISNDSKISSYSFSAYGTYSLPIGFYAAGALAFTHSKNNIRALRHDPSIGGASWAEADFNGSTFAAGVTIGYDFRPNQCFALSPSVGLNYLYHTMSDHDVRFGGPTTQRESDLKHDALLLPVEIRGHYDLLRGEKCALRFEANAGYTYNFDTDPMDGTILYNGIIWNNSGAAVSSSLRSREAEKHTYHLGAGIKYYYQNFDLGLKYDFIGSTNRTAHNILASAGVVF